jgi:ketosteroid isomerase-like protein
MPRLRSLTSVSLLLMAGCASRRPSPAGGFEAEVAGAERAFAEAAAREGIRDAFVRFASDSAVAFRPEPASAKALWTARGRIAGRLSWYPTYVRVARSGDVGFTTGPYESRDSTGALQGTGSYFTVWRREPQGWRWVMDLGAHHDPFATPPEPWRPSAVRAAAPSARMANADAARSLLAADSAFAARAEAAGLAAALREMAHPEMRLMRQGAFPRVGLAASVAAAEADSARRYSAEPARGYASAAGDLGWTWGEYRLVHPGAGRRETGHYVHVWSRDGDGPWRLLLEVVSPRPPERDE